MLEGHAGLIGHFVSLLTQKPEDETTDVYIYFWD